MRPRPNLTTFEAIVGFPTWAEHSCFASVGGQHVGGKEVGEANMSDEHRPASPWALAFDDKDLDPAQKERFIAALPILGDAIEKDAHRRARHNG
jgi:hypothetical protein